LIVNERWPIAELVDESIIKQAAYIESAVREFRSRLKTHMMPAKKTNITAAPPTRATIFVAKRYPSWKGLVLTILQQLYNVSSREYLSFSYLFRKIMNRCLITK
jgi:hypothetical protein